MGRLIAGGRGAGNADPGGILGVPLRPILWTFFAAMPPHLSDKHIHLRAANLADLYRLAAAEYGTRPAFATRRRDGSREFTTYAALYDKALCLGTALVELGLQARQHAALLSDNRLEWMLCDYAVLLCGAADVPRAADVTDQEICHIVDHSDSVLVFAEDRALLDRVLRHRALLPKVRHYILLEGNPPAGPNIHTLAELLARGRHLREAGDRCVEERMDGIKPEDVFTVIYTSGTTGTPKGVMLTHANMLSQVRNLPFELYPDDRMLSILPVWHSYERIFEMVAISRGACTYYTTLRTIGEDLKAVRPTMMASAPRLWEGLHSRILHNVKTAPAARQRIFATAYACSRRYHAARAFLSGQLLDVEGRTQLQSLRLAVHSLLDLGLCFLPVRLADRIVFRKLRAVVGGEFRGTVSGGGALPQHVDEFFNTIGIPVLEGYGMTETCPVLAVRTWGKRVIGTVGPFWPETEIRIVDLQSGAVLYPDPSHPAGGRGRKGGIHARGPQVMKGYYKDPEATARVLRDGWMDTGDIGMVTFNDCLKILGRSKETIVLLNGENVEPVPIESKLLESPLIEQVMVVGQDERHLGALIVPSLEALRSHRLELADLAAAAGDPQVLALIGAEVKRLVCREEGFKPFEFIQGWRLLDAPFQVGEELTATYKLRRHIIAGKHEKTINAIYQHDRPSKQF